MKTTGFFRSMLVLVACALMSACAGTTHSEGTGEYVDDTVITTKVKAALMGEQSLKSLQINVETFKGRVQLSGFVDSLKSMGTAVSLASGVAGVKSVRDDMRLR